MIKILKNPILVELEKDCNKFIGEQQLIFGSYTIKFEIYINVTNRPNYILIINY